MSNSQDRIRTEDLRGFLLEAGVNAAVTEQVMKVIDQYLACVDTEPFNCYLVKPQALALNEDCVTDYIMDLLAQLG